MMTKGRSRFKNLRRFTTAPQSNDGAADDMTSGRSGTMSDTRTGTS